MRGRVALGAGAAAVLSAVALAGTRGHGADGPVLPTPLLAAPEPAVSPVLTEAPAGRVLRLGVPTPEGVVATADGLAAIATRRPGRLVLVDVSGARPVLRRTVGVPGAARHLQLVAPGGPVLVPGEDTDTVAEVALPAGTLLRSTRVGRQPHDAAPVGGDVIVSDEFGRATSVLRDGSTIATLPGPLQPGGVAASGDRAAVVDVRGRLSYVYDVAPPRLVARLPAGAGPTHAVDVGGGVLVVADTDGGALVVTRVAGTPAVLATVPAPGKPYGLAFDATRRRLWVALSATNRLQRFDLTGPPEAPTLEARGTVATVRQPNSVAVWPRTGRVVVVGATSTGSVEVIDP